MGFGGVQGGFWGDLGGSGEVCFTPKGDILPLWKSCMASDLVPTTKYWSNKTMFTREASLTNFSAIGVLLGASKRPFYEQLKSFMKSKNSKHSKYKVQNPFFLR